jgi:pimeloyl-ACP methyl ester carboxylesterase
LLHGWPDDASTWDAVSARLGDRHLRLIALYLRGFAGSVFRNSATPRTANGAVLALDAIALMDGLGIEQFSVEALAMGWPERVDRMGAHAEPPEMCPRDFRRDIMTEPKALRAGLAVTLLERQEKVCRSAR